MIIICLTKQTQHATCQCGYGGVPGYCADPVSGYQMLSSYFYVSQVSRQTYIETMQPRLFEEWSSLYVRVRETGDWDIFLGPPERARAETGGAARLTNGC